MLTALTYFLEADRIQFIENAFLFFLFSLVVAVQRSVSENSLVAMDFSGRIGRVIDNPVEAQSAAKEEGYAWRVS